MFLEKLFGNTFGLILLIVFMIVVLGIIIFLFVVKEKDIVVINGIDEFVDEIENNSKVSELGSNLEENVDNKPEYEIIESEDGFFRVRKIGGERTLRKLSTREEAEEFVRQKENR